MPVHKIFMCIVTSRATAKKTIQNDMFKTIDCFNNSQSLKDREKQMKEKQGKQAETNGICKP